jgi:enterochelin esterase-like enzyme/outer membrane protein assembly factor BamB
VKSSILRLAVLSIILPAAALAVTESWPTYRGPEAASLRALPESFGLVVEWKQTLGSGYSSFVAADDRAVTMFTSGEDDVLAAFDLASGRELWRLRLAEKYAGHTGSDDGPVSTPTIDGDRVYALGPRGQLVAAALADGRELWRTQLDETRSSVPFYGYTTVPVVAGDALVVLTGGEGHALTAFDRATGDVLWSRHDDAVAYQTPVIAQLGGRQQLVAVTNQWTRGLDPKTGDELWSFRHTEGEDRNESAHPTPAGEDRVLIDLDAEAVMLEVAAQGGRLEAEELWRGRPFANTFALPVYRDGTLYGFTGNVLVAVDAATGDLLWRTRAVAGQNVSLVGDQLVVLDNDGAVVVAAASREGYRERTRVAALERGTFSNPAIAGGRILVRNLTEMASVRIDPGVRAAAVTPAVAPPKGEFGRFVAELAAVPAAQRQARLDAYLAGKSRPLVEPGGIVHLIWRGEADDVGVFGSVAGGGSLGLDRIEGTDVYYVSLDGLDPQSHYEYAFVVDFAQQPVPDSANPDSVEDFIVTSELRMPDWRVNPVLADPPAEAPRGQLDRFQFKSEALENTREIQVWLPPGYRAGGEGTHPLIVFTYGDRELRAGKMANVLDNLTAGGKIEPPVAVFVPRSGGGEYTSSQVDAYLRFLGDELVPHVEKHYRVAKEVGKRSILGVGSAGFAALYAAFVRPETFGKAAVQTFYLPDAIQEQAAKTIEESTARPALVWLEQSPYDYDRPPNNSLEDAPWLIETLRAKGIELRVDEVRGQPEWGSWRGQRDLILAALAPPSGE